MSKTKKILSAKDFMYVVRTECCKGCSRCKFKLPDIDILSSEKYCVFRDFKVMSDKSLSFIVGIAQTFFN